MPTPHEEIERFLSARGTESGDALAVAREFARCMCDELRDALAQWEFETDALRDGRCAARWPGSTVAAAAEADPAERSDNGH
jgi:hypothetical protein